MPDPEKNNGKKVTNGALGAKGGVTGNAFNAAKYTVKTNTSKSTILEIMKKIPGKKKPTWMVRYDRPHTTVATPHININPKISGVPDPHTPITPGQLQAVGQAGKVLEFMDKAAKPLMVIAVVIDTVRVGKSIYDDAKSDTTRNTVETATSVAGGWGGGFGGAYGGAALGTAIYPGLGTLIGGVLGGVVGGLGGSVAATALTEAVGDKLDYNIEEKYCKKCKARFKVRKYLKRDRNNDKCPDCR